MPRPRRQDLAAPAAPRVGGAEPMGFAPDGGAAAIEGRKSIRACRPEAPDRSSTINPWSAAAWPTTITKSHCPPTQARTEGPPASISRGTRTAAGRAGDRWSSHPAARRAWGRRQGRAAASGPALIGSAISARTQVSPVGVRGQHRSVDRRPSPLARYPERSAQERGPCSRRPLFRGLWRRRRLGLGF